MMRIFSVMLTLCLTFFGTLLQAEQRFESSGQPPLLVELYTSEGCSSCPPADKKAGLLLQREDLWTGVVPVVFHIDYWDYLGWKDQYANPQHSVRQRRLKSSGQLRAVYTPGWLVDGNEWRGYFQGKSMPAVSNRDGGKLTVNRQGSQLAVDYRPAASLNGLLTAHVAVMGFDYLTEVKRGENRGLDLSHQFVVIDKQASMGQGQWSFQLPAEVIREIEGNRRIAMALWINEEGNDQPLQVVGGWLE